MIVLVLPDLPAEDELLARARQGDESAMMEIYEAYFAPIYQFIRLRIGDSHTSEDLASDVFISFLEAVYRQKAPTLSLRGWLFQVARNKVARYYGEARQLPTQTLEEWVPTSSDDDPEGQFIRQMEVEHTRQAIRQLAPEQQEVLILRFGQQLNLQETADVMGKSIAAVKSLQFRAVTTLRQILNTLPSGVAHG